MAIEQEGGVVWAKRCIAYLSNYKAFGLLSLSALALKAATILAGFVTLRFVLPESMGKWQTAALLASYALFARFGLINGLNRELPFQFGRGDRELGLRMAATVQFHSLLCAMVGAAVTLACASALWSRGLEWRLATLGAGLAMSAEFYTGYVLATFRSGQDFERLAWFNFAQAGCMLLLPVLTWQWGFTGFCTQAVLRSFVGVILAQRFQSIRVKPRFDRAALMLVARTGLPLWGSSYLLTVALSLDRVVLLRWGGTADLGLYAPSLAVAASVTIVPSVLASYLYPRMSHRLGATGEQHQLWAMSVKGVISTLGLTVPLALVGTLVLPRLVIALFPPYAASINAMQWSLWAGALMSAQIVCTTPLGALRAYRWLYLLVGVVAVSRFTFCAWLGRSDQIVTGVALGTFVAATISLCVGLLATYQATHAPR